MDSEVLTVLKQARELISSPDKWCKGAFARDSAGLPVYPVDSDACYWCAEGAVGKVVTESNNCCLTDCKRELNKTVGGLFIFWNDKDERTHAEVLAAFDETIERLENEY